MDTHHHIWLHRRAGDGTIRSMERDDVVYPTRRRAITPCPMDVCTGTLARSCSASTVPPASPCLSRAETVRGNRKYHLETPAQPAGGRLDGPPVGMPT